MIIKNPKTKIILLFSLFLFSSCSNIKENEVKISCTDFAKYSQILTDESSDDFNGPDVREIHKTFIEFCENNEVLKIEDCGKFDDSLACKNTVGVQTDKIENCNNDFGCEAAFASTHIDDCYSFNKTGLTNACLYSKSYLENDRKYCDQIAELTSDDCDYTSEDVYISCYLNRGKCLWGISERNNDVSICDTIPGSTEADLCNFSMAVKLKDSLLCDKLKSVYFSKKLCIEVVKSNGNHPAFEEGILNYRSGTRPDDLECIEYYILGDPDYGIVSIDEKSTTEADYSRYLPPEELEFRADFKTVSPLGSDLMSDKFYLVGQLQNKVNYPYRHVLKALMLSNKIHAFSHLSSDLCLFEEDDSTEKYSATIFGTEHYCTNECYDEPFGFFIEINKIAGDIYYKNMR